MGVMSKHQTNIVNLEAKTLLAKLLATEDISVRHQAVETASFNVDSRVLTLPMWEKMDGSLYDMLVGHEVGHALFTPNELKEAIETVDPAGECSESTTFDYLNVVEDARIERLMQDKFPGLRRDFVRSYNDLFSRGFFGDVDEAEIEDRRLVDRVNLHYKVGRLLQIDFSVREQVVIDMIDRAETWEEVVEATRALYLLGREEAEKRAEEEREEQDEMGMPAPMCGDGEEESDSEAQGMGASGGEEDPEGEEGDGNGAGDGEGEDDAESTSATGDGDGEGESEDEADSTVSSAGAGNPELDRQMESETQRDFENSLKDKFHKDVGSKDRPQSFIGAPDTVTDHFVTSVPKFIEECVRDGHMLSWNDSRWYSLSQQLKQFENSTKKIVSGMVQRFEMMKAAHEHKRTMTSDTGMIDMSKLSGYKWDDNIFLKSEEVASGKNHGMIMYVDWSGSMCQIANDTMKQVLILAMFCKKVNIPFACYAFIGGFRNNNLWTRDVVSERIRDVKDADAVLGDIKLVEIATSEYSKEITRKGMAFWLGVAAANNSEGGGFRYPVSAYRQGGTPLDDAIAVGVNIANEFRSANNVEILSTVILTDGQTSSSPLAWGGEVWNDERGTSGQPKINDECVGQRVLYSKKNGKTYSGAHRHTCSTEIMMDYYKDHTGSSTTCIQICPRNRKDIGYWVSTMLADSNSACYVDYDGRLSIVEKVMKQGAHVLSEVGGFEQFIFMASESSKKVKGIDQVKQGSTSRVLANAFIREKQNRKRVTQVMDQFVDHISKEYV